MTDQPQPTPLHDRSYQCSATMIGPDRVVVSGRLTDTKPLGLGRTDGEPLVIHDMVVDLTVVMPSFEIEAVEVDMLTHPYPVCRGILDDYQQLVGTSIARGYSHRVRQLFGGPNGCSHIGALLVAMGPVAVQASWSLATIDEDPAERLDVSVGPEERERRTRLNSNTCHVWAEDGDHLKATVEGTSTIRPDWEVERLIKLGIEVPEGSPGA
ncbi:MAG: DUF2889 domain-containing protein [Acidimicrobiales bacterium]